MAAWVLVRVLDGRHGRGQYVLVYIVVRNIGQEARASDNSNQNLTGVQACDTKTDAIDGLCGAVTGERGPDAFIAARSGGASPRAVRPPRRCRPVR
jgi:hypothetical protein